MNRHIAYLFLIVSVFGFVGCASTTQVATSTTPTPTPTNGNTAPTFSASDSADITVTNSSGRVIPNGFLGLSHEWGAAQQLAGSASTGKNQIYRTLLRSLMPSSQSTLWLRIGGNSSDRQTSLSAGDLAAFADLRSDMPNNVLFTFGLNLASGDKQIAVAEAQSISRAIPSSAIGGYEIGNEPNGYPIYGIRPPTYSVSDYISEASGYNAAINAAVSSPVYVAPAFGAPPQKTWVNQYADYLTSTATPPKVVSAHYYITQYDKSTPHASDFLLSESNVTSGPSVLAPLIAAAHKVNAVFRVGEMNSLSGGGEPGISNAYGSALWGLDLMCEFANAGADGINWHTVNGGNYGLFLFRMSSTSGSSAVQYSLREVRPLFYGLQLFAQSIQSNGRLIPLTLDNRTGIHIKAWAFVGDDNKIRILLINKETTVDGKIGILASGRSSAQVLRLRGPSVDATSGITLGGQTYDGSVDGTMVGVQTLEMASGTNGVFEIQVPALSAALVTIAP